MADLTPQAKVCSSKHNKKRSVIGGTVDSVYTERVGVALYVRPEPVYGKFIRHAGINKKLSYETNGAQDLYRELNSSETTKYFYQSK